MRVTWPPLKSAHFLNPSLSHQILLTNWLAIIWHIPQWRIIMAQLFKMNRHLLHQYWRVIIQVTPATQWISLPRPFIMKTTGNKHRITMYREMSKSSYRLKCFNNSTADVQTECSLHMLPVSFYCCTFGLQL